MWHFKLPTFFLVSGLNLSVNAAEPPEQLWLRFVHLSDAHMIDEESPARAVLADRFVRASWRPQEAYSTHVLEATIQAINRIHSGQTVEGTAKPVDFVIHTGDAIDNAQNNELRWFIDVMDGGSIDPDSGAKDGAERSIAPQDNPNLSFNSEGLHKEISWYSVYGNHDALSVGNFRVKDEAERAPTEWTAPLESLIARVVGLTKIGRVDYLPTFDQSPAIIRASEEKIDPVTLKLQRKELGAGAIAPDSDRHYLSRQLFIEEHFKTRSNPPGHGFTEENKASKLARYSFRPKADVPIRFIVLDTVPMQASFGGFAYSGVMTNEQVNHFLVPELIKAKANGEYVILASHHPSEDFWASPDTLSQKQFRQLLGSYPHVLAHICGHTHRHKARIINNVQHTYIEIETGSLIEYPQEGRIFEIRFNSLSNEIRLTSTIFSHSENPTHLSKESFRRARIDDTRKGKVQDQDRDTDISRQTFLTQGWDWLLPSSMEKHMGDHRPILSRDEKYGKASDRFLELTFKPLKRR